MSFQRAVINCRRCYEEASKMKTSFPDKPLITDNSLFVMRENAMKSLEDAMKSLDDSTKVLADTALYVCMRCKYENPGIVEYLRHNGPEELRDNIKEIKVRVI